MLFHPVRIKVSIAILILVACCCVFTSSNNIGYAAEWSPAAELIPNEFTPSWFALYAGDKERYQLELNKQGIDRFGLSSKWVPTWILKLSDKVGFLSGIGEPSPFKFFSIDPSNPAAGMNLGVGLPEVRGLELKFRW